MFGLLRVGAVLGGVGAIAFGLGFLVSQIRGWENDIIEDARAATIAEQREAIMDAQEAARIAAEERDAARADARREFDSRSARERQNFARQLQKAREDNATLDQCLRLPPVPIGLQPKTGPAGGLRD